MTRMSPPHPSLNLKCLLPFGRQCGHHDLAIQMCPFLDSSLVGALQQAALGKGERCDQALGCFRGELTTRIHLLADGEGWSLRFILTGGQPTDIFSTPAMIEGMKAQVLALNVDSV